MNSGQGGWRPLIHTNHGKMSTRDGRGCEKVVTNKLRSAFHLFEMKQSR
jgi:hypothetical protein